mmetsp:Transcript_9746/g.17648  ORF Transcript_9746/g.17648 Transcript_9746/m.17648 type:complete len:639 (+) Transcript_9746:232-2148(+)
MPSISCPVLNNNEGDEKHAGTDSSGQEEDNGDDVVDGETNLSEQEGKDRALEIGKSDATNTNNGKGREGESSIDSNKIDTHVMAGSPEQLDEKGDNSDDDLLSLQSESLGEAIRTPPLPETDDCVRLTRSAAKKRKKEGINVEEEDLNKEETKVEKKATETGHKDGLLASSPTKKKMKRYRLPKMPFPKITPPEVLAAVNQMNAGMMMNPPMMYQLRNNLMHNAANTAQAQNMMAGGIAPAMMMAANGGFPPAMMMAAANGGGGAPNAMANNIMGGNEIFFSPSNGTANNNVSQVQSYEMVTLYLPVDRPLGMVLDDNATTGKPELKRLTKDSPIKRQIPIGFQSGCCISYMKSERIGYVEPKSAKECVELVAKSKEGATTKTVKMEMLLVMASSELKGTLKEPKKGRPRGGKNWTTQYGSLARYKEKYGHCNVPHSHNPALAKWVLEQREGVKKNLMGEKRVQQLDMIGFDWDDPWDDNDHLSMSWDDTYCALVRFKDRCGLLPSSGSLHEWMEQQRKAVVDFTITLEHARKLRKLGMELPAKFTDGLKCAAGANIVEEAVGVDDGGPKSKRRKVSQEHSKETSPTSLFWKSVEAANVFGFKRGGEPNNPWLLDAGWEDVDFVSLVQFCFCGLISML